MTYNHDRVLDNGLNEFTSNANRLDLCSVEPATYTEATSTYTKANKTSWSIGSPAAGSPNGRKVATTLITGASVTATATVVSYAISDTVNSRLLLAASLATSRSLVSGDTFSMASFDIRYPAAT